jgi:hypothetical protein
MGGTGIKEYGSTIREQAWHSRAVSYPMERLYVYKLITRHKTDDFYAIISTTC